MTKKKAPASDEYLAFCRLRKKVTDARWQAANRAFVREYNLKYYEVNRDSIIKRNGEWQMANRLARNKYKREWYARKKAKERSCSNG